MTSPSDDSKSVEQLLRLKRHEQPPPRYFNEFSDRVVSRIEAGEGRLSWWEKFGFDLRPAFAAAAGMAACVLVVYGVATTDGGDELAKVGTQFGGTSPFDSAASVLHSTVEQTTANSTNPVVDFGTPVDRKVFGSKLIPASFRTD